MANKVSEGLKNRMAMLLVVSMLVAAVAIFAAPQLSARGKVFVDDDAQGKMDGSEKYPYKKIQDAINRASEKDRDVFVYKGHYQENLELWSDIQLVGEERGQVVIEADDDDQPVVLAYDDSELHNLVLREGHNGVRVKRGAKVTISNCDIIDNDKDGIKARESDTKNDEKLEIYGSYIAHNGGTGIFTERKKVYIEGNLIEENDKDGIELSKGSEGTIKKNRVKDNEGVGIKLFIDESEISVDGVTIRGNDRDGIEVRTEGAEGFIHIEDCKFNDNKRWAIARIEAHPLSDAAWHRSLLVEEPTFIDSNFGNISPFIRVY